MFKCCRCNNYKYLDICSYNWNKSCDEKLCSHFNVIYSFKTHYRFFSIGWSVEFDIKTRCRECWGTSPTLCDYTFRKNDTSYNNYHECCDNVFTFGVRGNGHDCDYQGIRRQKEIFEDKRREREERERREREERERKERERKERERKERELQESINNLNDIINYEETVNNNINSDLNEIVEDETITDWKDEELDKMTSIAETTFSIAIDFNLVEEWNKFYNFQMIKK